MNEDQKQHQQEVLDALKVLDQALDRVKTPECRIESLPLLGALLNTTAHFKAMKELVDQTQWQDITGDLNCGKQTEVQHLCSCPKGEDEVHADQ